MLLNEKILTLRMRAGMSQGKMAELLDVSRQAVSKWETGQAVPDLEKIKKISKLFDVSIDVLVKDECTLSESVTEEAKIQDTYTTQKVTCKSDKITAKEIGVILLVAALICVILAFFTQGMSLLLAVPFFVLGVEVILVPRNHLILVGGWSLWGMSMLVFNRVYTSVSWSILLQWVLNPRSFSISIFVALIQVLVLVLLVWYSVKKLRERKQ